MKQLSQANDLNNNQKVCLAIGMFDGVHLGHQKVLQNAINAASQSNAISVAVTFDQHPANIISPKNAPSLIQTQAQRNRSIELLGVDAILIIKFNEAFSRKTGKSFIQELAQGFGSIHSISVGNDFMFGHNRDGNFQLLQKLSQELNFLTYGLQPVKLNGQIVSSTRIRSALINGKIDDAKQMLGRKFSIEGPVVKGDGKGREIGFPTANIDTKNLILPPNGVYASYTKFNGKTHKSLLNIGVRPTIIKPNPSIQVEAHILKFNENIYDQVIDIELIEKLRNEMKFESIEELKKQISCDIENAKSFFK
ncbi:MAG: riboflavin biosynthesis protein RibF [Opitutia bacterium TMED67]|nr:riboflavin biosynthesis protein RibF [Verrucomicrobiales bacterium]OUU72495.1 MAG: riboflavin biosynthesis protein RibF [Opitutae bacterium TMED67]|tara:strand:+ start:3506 stop:4429 length:924 start_codon:yes stop_codon:yes gene_type:complete